MKKRVLTAVAALVMPFAAHGQVKQKFVVDAAEDVLTRFRDDLFSLAKDLTGPSGPKTQ